MTKKNILNILQILTSMTLILVLLIISIINRDFFNNYSYLCKDISLFFCTTFYFSANLLIKPKSKLSIAISSFILSSLFTVHMMCINNSYNYIEIQHYYSWSHSITFFEVLKSEVNYSISSGNSIYFALYIGMMILCIVSSSISLINIKELETFDNYEPIFENSTPIYKSKKNISQSKLNSQKRSRIRRKYGKYL